MPDQLSTSHLNHVVRQYNVEVRVHDDYAFLTVHDLKQIDNIITAALLDAHRQIETNTVSCTVVINPS